MRTNTSSLTWMGIILTAYLPIQTASAQVNKGILGHSNNRDSGYVQLRGNTDETIVYLGSISDSGDNRDLGNLQLKDGTGTSGITRAQLYVPSGRGILKLEDDDDNIRVDLRSSLDDYGSSNNESYGLFRLYGGASENEIVFLGGSNSSPRQGQLYLRHADDDLSRLSAFVSSDKEAYLRLYNEDRSVRSVQLSSAGDGGTVRVRAGTNVTVGTLRAVEDSGQDCGQLFLSGTGGNSVLIDGCQGVKNAVIDHPSDRKKQIFYAAMEGPEVGLYTRGVGTLKNGKARVQFPDHFAGIVGKKGLTVQLTPHSAQSLGLAAVKLSPKGLEVHELGGDLAKGNYDFSFTVQGVRAGSEKYPVVRDAIDFAKLDAKEADQGERPLNDQEHDDTVDIETEKE